MPRRPPRGTATRVHTSAGVCRSAVLAAISGVAVTLPALPALVSRMKNELRNPIPN